MASLSKLYTRKEIDAIRQALIDKHGDHCFICRKPGSAFKKRLSVDHAHRSGRVRGLLCFYCNRMLVARHTIESAREVLAYLEAFDIPLTEGK